MYNKFSSLVKNNGLEFAAQTAKNLGFSSVELFDMAGTDSTPTFPDVESAIHARKILDSFGLSVACYSVGVNLVTLSDGIKRNEKAIKELLNYANIAKTLGSPYLHHTMIISLRLPENAPNFEEVLSPVVGVATEVARYCEHLGLTCLYEDQGMYFNGTKQFGVFFEEMKKLNTNVGVCADIGNILFVDEDPLPFFNAFKDDIKHVHLKDYKIHDPKSCLEAYKLSSKGGKYLESVMIGKGDIDIIPCLDVLKTSNYSGAIALEDDHKEDFTLGVHAAMSLVNKVF